MGFKQTAQSHVACNKLINALQNENYKLSKEVLQLTAQVIHLSAEVDKHEEDKLIRLNGGTYDVLEEE